MSFHSTEFLLAILSIVLPLAVIFLIVYFAVHAALRRKALSVDAASQTLDDQSPRAMTGAVAGRAGPSAEASSIKHAFDFDEDRISMVLEMPVSFLEDDDALSEGWVDVVSWARMAYSDMLRKQLTTMAEEVDEAAPDVDAQQVTREKLEESLKRLHDSAERRRELRMKLAEQRQ
ncbi:MAG: hypothetical protein DSY55_03590 [Clostridia bacterium]|nr:MAG: hypothetical protein DSY55_03590 [Clostridia bacterium]